MAVVARGRSGLELNHPRLDRLFAEAAVTAKPHVRDAPRARLRPDPFLGHAEPFRHLFGCEKGRHRRSLIARVPGRAPGRARARGGARRCGGPSRGIGCGRRGLRRRAARRGAARPAGVAGSRHGVRAGPRLWRSCFELARGGEGASVRARSPRRRRRATAWRCSRSRVGEQRARSSGRPDVDRERGLRARRELGGEAGDRVDAVRVGRARTRHAPSRGHARRRGGCVSRPRLSAV